MTIDLSVPGVAGIGRDPNKPVPRLTVSLRRDQRPGNAFGNVCIGVAGTQCGDNKRMGLLKRQNEVI